EVLDFLVAIDDPAAEHLRMQAETALVTKECECGCGAIELEVDYEGTPRADLGSMEVPVLRGRFRRRRREVFVCGHMTSTYVDPEDPEATRWLISGGGWRLDRGHRGRLAQRLNATSERPSFGGGLFSTRERTLDPRRTRYTGWLAGGAVCCIGVGERSRV